MKIAIVGAGISGLSCAIELQRHGIEPTIYEKKGYIGEGNNFIGASFRQFHHNRRNPVKHIRKEYNLDIKPLSIIDELTMESKNKQFTTKGSNLGYFFKRGEDKYSLENQLASQLKLPIRFESDVDIETLMNEYETVIVATGNGKIAMKFGLWNVRMISQCRIATVIGMFKPGMLKMWLNTDYTKQGFCFMATESEKQAYITLIVNSITSSELDHYWENFLDSQKISERIIMTTDQEENTGYPENLIYKNVMFIGNAAGMVDSAIGFGALNAIESGFLAARSILLKLDYEKLIRPIKLHIDSLCHVRTILNEFDNKCFDRFVGMLRVPGIKDIVYNTPFFRINDIMPAIKLYNGFKGSTNRGGQ